MAVASLVALLAAACGSDVAPQPIDLVPANAQVLGLVDLGKILSDEDVNDLYEEFVGDSGPPTLPAALDEAEAELGISLREFSQLVFFTDLGDDEYGAILAAGEFDRDAIFDVIRAHSGEPIEPTDYGGEMLLIQADADNSQTAVTVLAGEVFVAGELSAVQHVVDVHAGDRDALEGGIRDLYDDLGDPWVKAAVAIEPETFGDLGDLSDGLTFDLSFLNEIEAIGITADKQGNDLTVDARLNYASEASAEEAAEVIGALITLIGTFGADETGVLDGIEVTASGAAVMIGLSMTLNELRELAEDGGSLGGDGFGLHGFGI